jgi:hypothetical protein
MQSEPLASLDLKVAALEARPPGQMLLSDHAKSLSMPAAKDQHFSVLSGSKPLTHSLFSAASSSNFRAELEKLAVVDRANAAVRESAEILGLYSSEMRGASESALSSKRRYPKLLPEEFFGLDNKAVDLSSVIAGAGQTADLDHLQVALKRCYEYFETFSSEFTPNSPDKVVTTATIKKKVQNMDIQLRIAMKKAELAKEMMEGTIRRSQRITAVSCNRPSLQSVLEVN